MMDFQQKKRVRKMLYSRNVVIALAVVTLLLLRGVVDVVGKERQSENDVVVANEQLAQAKLRNQQLTSDTASLATVAGMDRAIRQEFSVAKPGEEVAFIVDSPTVPSPVATSTPVGFWGSILNWFGHIFH
jgi:cell division protein FtsB